MCSCDYMCPRNHIHVLHVCACVYAWAAPYVYGCVHVCVCMCTCVAVGGNQWEQSLIWEHFLCGKKQGLVVVSHCARSLPCPAQLHVNVAQPHQAS